MKQVALKLMHSSGLFAPFRFLNRHKVLILMYHRFSQTDDGLSTSAADFENQLRYLRQRYRLISLGEAVSQLLNGQTESNRAVITIDDGYGDAYKVALPLLRKYGIPATIFVVTEFIDRKIWLWTDKPRFATLRSEKTQVAFEFHDKLIQLKLSDRKSRLQAAATINTCLKSMADEQKENALAELSNQLEVPIPQTPPCEFEALTWDQLREMEKEGIEVGSHTHSHPILTKIPLDRVEFELKRSKERLESMLGHDVPLFCYPNGISNHEIREEVRRAGYTSAVTATHGFNDKDPDMFALRRISAEHDLPHFAQNTSGFEGFKNSLRSHNSTPELS